MVFELNFIHQKWKSSKTYLLCWKEGRKDKEGREGKGKGRDTKCWNRGLRISVWDQTGGCQKWVDKMGIKEKKKKKFCPQIIHALCSKVKQIHNCLKKHVMMMPKHIIRSSEVHLMKENNMEYEPRAGWESALRSARLLPPAFRASLLQGTCLDHQPFF